MNNNAETKGNNNAENNQNPIIEFINELNVLNLMHQIVQFL